jgi:hypothetical protein
MAKLITSGPIIETMCRERQASEQRLAKRLYEAFAGGQAIAKLQTVGCRVVQQMIDRDDQPLKKVLSECQMLDMFKSQRFTSLAAILQHPRDLTPSDIADIIYVCGEWVLAGGGSSKWHLKEIQGAYKVGATVTKPVRDGEGWAARHAQVADHAVWKQEAGGRYRGNWDQPDERHVFDHRGPASVSGISSKRSLDGSTVLKIDRLFGLLRGADISGSTTEATSVLERWGHDILHSAYYLLPLATLVYNCHHTVLEVALALSLNGINDYHIGFYTTLLPDGAPDELRDVIAALSDAEAQARHFVVFHDNATPVGCIEFDRSWEKKLLKSSGFGRGVDMLANAQQLSSFPSQAEVFDLIRRTGPQLVAALPGGATAPVVKLSVF